MQDKYKHRDIVWSEEGDVVLKNGDFELSTPMQCVKQDAYNRIKTSNPDWYRHNIGADLEDLFGKNNNAITAQEGIEKITKSLLKNNRFDIGDITIDAVPVSKEQIDFFIFIDVGSYKPLIIKHEVEL